MGEARELWTGDAESDIKSVQHMKKNTEMFSFFSNLLTLEDSIKEQEFLIGAYINIRYLINLFN